MSSCPELEAIVSSNIPQSDKTTQSLALLTSLLTSSTPPPATPLINFAKTLITSSSVSTVVGRQLLNTVVLALVSGSGLPEKVYASGGGGLSEEDKKWLLVGLKAFRDENGGDEGTERRKEVVEGILQGNPTGWCEEQTSTLKSLLSHILEQEEDWSGSAKILMSIPMESGSRMISDQQKLDIYMKIVRLLIEAQEAGQATTYLSRVSLLMHNCNDKETQLSFKLSQARIADFTRKFNDAAARYHELSFNGDIAEEERIYMLNAGVTCAILAPAGPQRSRILANLYRDDRTANSLPTYASSILKKMFLDHILRSSEVKEFESKLDEHQLARLPADRRITPDDDDYYTKETGEKALKGRKGAESVLDKAVMEHNVLACAKVYDNIGFDGLGALLDLMPSAAEAMARQMIEQGRLRAWIDQVDKLIYFEGRDHQDNDDGQATAGGLGIEKVEKEIAGITLTERWDERIKETAMHVEAISNVIISKELLSFQNTAGGDAMVLA